jgi:hypothetical protein
VVNVDAVLWGGLLAIGISQAKVGREKGASLTHPLGRTDPYDSGLSIGVH